MYNNGIVPRGCSVFMHRPEHKMLRIWKYVTNVTHGPRASGGKAFPLLNCTGVTVQRGGKNR